jgi:hypothetical protein
LEGTPQLLEIQATSFDVYKKYKFDWVMSYRRDADVFSPYGLVQKRAKIPESVIYCVVTILSRLLHHKRNRSTIGTNKIKNRPQNPQGTSS